MDARITLKYTFLNKSYTVNKRYTITEFEDMQLMWGYDLNNIINIPITFDADTNTEHISAMFNVRPTWAGESDNTTIWWRYDTNRLPHAWGDKINHIKQLVTIDIEAECNFTLLENGKIIDYKIVEDVPGYIYIDALEYGIMLAKLTISYGGVTYSRYRAIACY